MPMLDMRTIRADPESVKRALKALNTEAPIDEVLELDEQRREVLQEL